jgi:hypothetical protein
VRDALAWDRVMLRNDLRLYIRQAWHVVEPSTVYLENWHIDLIAEYLEAVTAGHIKRLLINMPPRYAKSTCVSIMWPTWVWAREAYPQAPRLAENCAELIRGRRSSASRFPGARLERRSPLRKSQVLGQHPITLPMDHFTK